MLEFSNMILFPQTYTYTKFRNSSLYHYQYFNLSQINGYHCTQISFLLHLNLTKFVQTPSHSGGPPHFRFQNQNLKRSVSRVPQFKWQPWYHKNTTRIPINLTRRLKDYCSTSLSSLAVITLLKNHVITFYCNLSNFGFTDP